MNTLKKVTKCQNYIMFTQLHQDKSKITSRSKTSQAGRISELEDEKLGQKPLCAMLISICAVLLCEKTGFLTKKFQNDKKFPKSLEIWVGVSLSSVMMS